MMAHQNVLVLTALAMGLGARVGSAQAMVPQPLRLTIPALDARLAGTPRASSGGGVLPWRDGRSDNAAHASIIDYNERLRIRTAEDDRDIAPFLLIGGAAGAVLGYAIARSRTNQTGYDAWISDEGVYAFGMVAGATVGVVVGAIAFSIGPRGPSDREPPTPQPPRP